MTADADDDSGIESSEAYTLTSGGDAIVWTLEEDNPLILIGTVVSDGEGPSAGQIVARVEVTDVATGDYTFSLLGPIDHPDEAMLDNDFDSYDELKTLSADDLIQLTATITDNDGDVQSATLDIGQDLNFADDGPTIRFGEPFTMDFTSGDDSDDMYVEGGMVVTNTYGHQHFSNGGLWEHTGGGRIYTFELAEGGVFDLTGFDVTEISGSGTQLFTAFSGTTAVGSIEITSANDPDVLNIGDNSDFQGITSFQWDNDNNGSMIIDNLAFTVGDGNEATVDEADLDAPPAPCEPAGVVVVQLQATAIDFGADGGDVSEPGRE